MGASASTTTATKRYPTHLLSESEYSGEYDPVCIGAHKVFDRGFEWSERHIMPLIGQQGLGCDIDCPYHVIAFLRADKIILVMMITQSRGVNCRVRHAS